MTEKPLPMLRLTGPTLTPVFVKTADEMPWPEDPFFYLLTRDGLFLCRNHPFFRSCVPVETGPGELGTQNPSLKPTYPLLRRVLFEQVIGFFHQVGKVHGSEAAVLLAWNQQKNEVAVVVPKQEATVSTSWFGDRYPMDVSYEIPPLPAHLVLMGDIHSHVDGPAYASSIDKGDEVHRPGLHIVVGRIWDEPPQFHIEITVDGFRFPVKDLRTVCEGYSRRSLAFPPEWMEALTVVPWKSYKYSSANTSESSCYTSYSSKP